MQKTDYILVVGGGAAAGTSAAGATGATGAAGVTGASGMGANTGKYSCGIIILQMLVKGNGQVISGFA